MALRPQLRNGTVRTGMNARGHRWSGKLLALALGSAVLTGVSGCKTIHEEIQPIRETTLTVARAGGDVTLSWIGLSGMYYSVMYTDARGAKAQWHLLADAINVRAVASGEPIVVKDRLDPSKQRYYRLQQDSKPLVP
jgi:hypothetical protein